MIKVENDTVEVKGNLEGITYDLTILLNSLMKKEKLADVIIAVAISTAKEMIKKDINGTDLSESVNVTLKRPK